MKKLETQIVVIAGGPSGLCAAVQAAEDGADVILVEKGGVVGGAANMGMGPLGIGTKYQKRAMQEITVEQAFNMFMEYAHYNVDGRLIKRYFEQSAETIEWLEDKGVEFEGAYRYFPKAEPTWHIVKSGSGIGPRAAGAMNKALYKAAQDLGVEFLLNTAANKVVMEDGRVAGVLATDNNGEEYEISCKAAIICTGGAGANKEFIKEQTGFNHGDDLFSFAIPGIMGDGLRMAWEAGADRLPVRIEAAANLEGIEELPESVANIFFQPNLLVNKFGLRVMNEEQMQNTTFLHNVAAHQKDKIAYSIVDTSIVKGYVRNGVDVVCLVRPNEDVSDFFDAVEIAQKNGIDGLIIADSIEELAEKLGVDAETLEETIENYNDMCETGDEEFFKDKKFMKPIRKAPYYAAAIRPGGYGTVGGIRINENCEACDKDFMPVPGLYAAGADSCNIYDDSYMFLLPGNSMGYAVNTGRIAGMEAAEYVDED